MPKSRSAVIVVDHPPNEQRKAKRKRNRAKRKVAVISNSNGQITQRMKDVVSHPMISGGGAAYIAAVLDPRSGPLAPVPYGFPVKSRLIRVKCTGTFTSSASASAVAFVVINPWKMVANNSSSVYVSNATYVGTDGTILSNNSTGVDPLDSNSDYTLTSISTAQVGFRLVSASLEVGATSNLLNRQGSFCIFTEPSHQNLISQYADTVPGISPSQIYSYEQAKLQPVMMTGKFQKIIWGVPENPAEAEFFNYEDVVAQRALLQAAPISWTANQSGEFVASSSQYQRFFSYNMCAIATGGATATTAPSYRFEAYAVFEVSGPTITGKTPGNSDTSAFTAVANFLQEGKSNGMRVPESGFSVQRVLGDYMKSLGAVRTDGTIDWFQASSKVASAAVNTYSKALTYVHGASMLSGAGVLL